MTFLYNEVDKVMYWYDYYNGKISTYMNLGDIKITDHFYLEEDDKIYFLDNEKMSGYCTFSFKTKKMEFYNSEEY